MKKRIIILIISALLIIGAGATAIYFNQSVSVPTNNVQTQQDVLGTTTSKEITYKGKDGVTALDLLEQFAKIKTSGTGEMAYVTTINNITANSTNEYWQLNINGKSASVGAGSYVTKNSETITWKLVTF